MLQRLVPLLGLFVLTFILYVAAALPTCITGGIAAAAGADDWLVIAFALVVGLPPFLYVVTRLALAFQAFMLDDAGPAGAIAESWRLSADNIPRLFAVLLVTLVATTAIQTGVSYVVQPAGDPAAIILNSVVAVPLAAFAVAALTLYYLRIRETGPVRETIHSPEPAPGRGW